MSYLDSDYRIPGLVDGIEYHQNERIDELNDRIFYRVQADAPLQPLYNPRPAITKYSVFPTVDIRKTPTLPLDSYLDYSTEGSFAPMQSRGPIHTYFQNVNTESNLRNQMYALSSAPQRVFVPSSNSDLYRERRVGGSLNDPQPYPQLFKQSTFDSSPHPNLVANPEIGSLNFFNDTRAQLRGDGYSR